MYVSVNTLSKRLAEVMDALDKKERVVLSHAGKKFAVLQPVSDIENEIQRIKKHPAVGMWADREDMKNPTEWVREKRRSRREKLFETDKGIAK
jgi:prevent-host-death family protein